MIYYVKVQNEFYPVSDLKGSIDGFKTSNGSWSLRVMTPDSRSTSLEKSDTDGHLYTTQGNVTPLTLDVDLDELNLKNNDEFNLTIDQARLTILKLKNYIDNFNKLVCLTK